MEKVKETVSSNFVRESGFLLDKQIQDALTDNAKIELPSDFLKDYLFTINGGKFSKEQIEKEYDQYEKEIKWNLIKGKIVSDNAIKVENEDVVTEAKSIIKERYMNAFPGTEMDEIMNALADNYLKHENGKNYRDLSEKVLNDRVLNFVKENITINQKKVSVDEFKKLTAN